MNSTLSENVNASATIEGIDKVDRVQASVFARVGPTDVYVDASQVDGQPVATRATVRGGLVVHAGGITMMPQQNSDAGFAVLDLGAPDIKIANGLGGSAETNASGFAVLSIPALHKAKIEIDPNTAVDGLDLATISAVTHRAAGVKIKRHAVRGQFVIPPVTSGVLVLDGNSYPITERGAWLELPIGKYAATVAGQPFNFEIL